MAVIWVALGGACGAVLRFGVSRALTPLASGYPVATLLVNVFGSFLIGLLAGSVLLENRLEPGAKLFFQTGLLGAFTTFSAFSLETLQLWQSGHSRLALANVIVNVVFCLVAVAVGFGLGAALAARVK